MLRVAVRLFEDFDTESILSFGLNEFNNEPTDPEKKIILISYSEMLKRLLAPALWKP